MKKLTLGQLRELLESALEKLKSDPDNTTLRNAVDKLEAGIKQEQLHPPRREQV